MEHKLIIISSHLEAGTRSIDLESMEIKFLFSKV